jgi:hypothetical protein
MKPLHAGLLIAGAALAGGLAIKMTEPQPIPVAPAPVSIEVKHEAPPPTPPPTVAPLVAAPVKPSPFPNSVAAAPAPVYEEPARAQIPKTPIRKDKPILTAKATAPVANAGLVNSMPPFLPPVPYEAPASQPRPEPKAEPAPQPEPKFSPHQVTLPAGMTVQIRLNESLSSDRRAPGDTFDASLAEPLIIDGLVIAERGARAGGRVVGAQKADAQKAGGTSSVALELTNLVTADGQKIAISTDPWTKRGDTSRAEDAAKIGGGAALGAMIGAIAGGGTGAAIGAGVGGAAGVGTVLATRGKPVNIPSETIIRFRLATRVTIKERQL